MKKTILLNAGHSTDDPGAMANGIIEAKLNMKIRDLLVPKLRANGFKVLQVPDHLNLTRSIDWVNSRISKLNDGLAFSIHFNSARYIGTGAETYYHSNNEPSKAIATNIINTYCKVTGLYNRGAKSDTQARYNRLGWIRNTKCWAGLIECAFINNKNDMKIVYDNLDRIAEGLLQGILKAYKIKKSTLTKVDPIKDKRAKLIELIKIVIAEMKLFINELLK